MALTWTSSAITPSAFIFSEAFWSASLNLFIVHNLGDGVSSPMQYISTSPDGTTWTARTTSVTAQTSDAMFWNELAGVAVMIGNNAYEYSTDAINWTASTPPASHAAVARVAIAGNASIIIALGANNSTTEDLIYSTDDGATWNNGTCVAGNWRAAAWSPALSLFVAVGTVGGTNEVMTSPDGLNWTARTPSVTGIQWNEVLWAPAISKFIAYSPDNGGRAMTSTDGTTWTVGSVLYSTLIAYYGVTWSEDLGLAIAIRDSIAEDVSYLSSSDGVTWTETTIAPAINDFNSSSGRAANIGTWSPSLYKFLWVSANSTHDALIASGTVSVESTGWYKSDVPGLETGVDATTVEGASARPNGPRGQIIVTPFTASRPLYGFPGHAIAYNNRMIYAAGDYTVATDLPPIRTWNGTSDYLLARVPRDGSGNIPKAITTIINGDGNVYLGTWDYGTSNADVAGRILKLDPNSGQLTNVGNVNTLTGYIPQALAFHNGELWAGLGRSDTSAGKIYRIKPAEQTSWTQDRDMTTDSVGGCTAIVSYKGQMYFGSSAASGTFAKFGSRSASGTYGLVYTGTGGTAQDYNGFYAAAVFGDNLYFSYWNPDTTEVSLIKKYDGSTVTTAYTVTSVADVPIIGLFVHDGVLYAIGSRRVGDTYTSVVLTTTDGTTWTDRTGDLPLGSFTSRGVTNAFATIAY